MIYTYEINTFINTNEESVTNIFRTDEAGHTVTIPTDPANSDYQAYLASLEAPQG
jgi:hypothetical protein